jgi:hypothetical protein
MRNNLFFLLTGDPGRERLDPDLLGEMVKIEQGSNLLNQIFNLITRYVRKVCATMLGEVSSILLDQVT